MASCGGTSHDSLAIMIAKDYFFSVFRKVSSDFFSIVE